MGIRGVKKRMTSLVKLAVEENRSVTEQELREIIDYAKGYSCFGFGLSKSARKTILQPDNYLIEAGVDIEKVCFSSDAYELAQKIGDKSFIEA